MSTIIDRPARPPRCCGTPMSPARPYTVLAVRHDKDGTATEVESTVWECEACGKKEGRPERWTTVGTVMRNGYHRGRA